MDDRASSIRSIIQSLGRWFLFPLAEAVWSLTFKAIGLLWRPKLGLINPTGHDKVLVIAPHPDDETIGCGGTIALHSLSGDAMCVCIVTDGGRSRGGGFSREEICRRRREEAVLACGVLGNVGLVQLGLPEGLWHEQQLARPLELLLEDYKPTIIYSPSGIDYHPEHIRVAQVLARVMQSNMFAAKPRVRVYEVQVPLTPLLANAATDISQSKVRKTSALASYNSQQQGLVWLPRFERYRKELYRLPGPNEVFREMSAESFSILMQTAVTGLVRYFGIRPRPFTDGAVWLVGTMERVRLMRRLREH
jgi:LmbE family N-acetylglucosaminyl deacetylase